MTMRPQQYTADMKGVYTQQYTADMKGLFPQQYTEDIKGVYPIRALFSACRRVHDIFRIHLHHYPLRVRLMVIAVFTTLTAVSVYCLTYLLITWVWGGGSDAGLQKEQSRVSFMMSEGMHDAFARRIKRASRFKKFM